MSAAAAVEQRPRQHKHDSAEQKNELARPAPPSSSVWGCTEQADPTSGFQIWRWQNVNAAFKASALITYTSGVQCRLLMLLFKHRVEGEFESVWDRNVWFFLVAAEHVSLHVFDLISGLNI